ncbi:MAG: carboxypeptidase regulatory-like domain-containing protein, partial [Planctomycetota bacterium]|nr:carboxypeptidase regulatory-like domain-containing protein [Planctomycetota bacterium]
MRRLQPVLIALAATFALLTLGYILFMGTPPPEPVFEVRDAEKAPAPSAMDADRPVEGGVYGGRIETLDGRPIAGARVLLVAYDGGRPSMLTQGAGADPDPDVIADVPVVGRYRIGGEGLTDADGGFRIAADAQSMITRVLAYHEGFFLSVVEVTRPRDDLLLRLQPGGRVIGRVVDDETGEPVPGAVIDLYLQQKVSKVSDDAGTYTVINRKPHKMSWLASLGRFIGETLGPRIWNVLDSTSETLKLRTDKNGRFEIGPLGNSVQLEFVITHSRYKWVDFDTEDGQTTPARLVVQPGDTVEREFRMRKGKHIRGKVVDEDGKGVADVFVKVQSISAYYRHWWYKHRWRRTRTDSKGHFRVDGLAIGSQQIIFQHPSFKEITESVEAGTDEFLVVVERFGALRGTVEGVARSRNRRRLAVMFESLDTTSGAAEQFRRRVPMEVDNTFLVERIPPGKYRAWVKAGKESSQPVEVEILALEVVKET